MRMLIIIFALVFLVVGTTPGQTTKPVAPGREEEEAVFNKAIKILAKDFEKKTGFHFDKNWEPRTSIEYGLGNRDTGDPAAMYVAEDEVIKFPISLTYRLCVDHDKVPVRLMDPAVLAGDKSFAKLVRHELGHVLMDQVSRRSGLGPWFTVEEFEKKSAEEQLGVNILSEGTATFFEEADGAPSYKGTEVAFPTADDAMRASYTYTMVAFEGGYWLVRDVLTQHGERGLVWLMSHPFKADQADMRKAAVAYRERALAELGKK